MTNRNERGQVLPITALFMTALLLSAALAVDVSSVLSAERSYTAIADAAALAGGQDLQQAKSRLITDTERGRARTHAMAVLVDRLGLTDRYRSPSATRHTASHSRGSWARPSGTCRRRGSLG